MKMKIKPMGKMSADAPMLSTDMEDYITEQMKMNALFGFDVSAKKSNSAFVAVHYTGIETGNPEEGVFVNIENVTGNIREFEITPDYKVFDAKELPEFSALNKSFDSNFKVKNVENINDGESYLKITLKNTMVVESSVDKSPVKIKISCTKDNTFDVFSGNIYCIITIIPSSMAVPMIKVLDITDIVLAQYAELLAGHITDQGVELDEDEDPLFLSDDYDEDGTIFTAAIQGVIDASWGSEWLTYEIQDYSTSIGEKHSTPLFEENDYPTIYDVVYNSYYAKFTSEIIDTKTNQVQESYADLPIATQKYDIEEYLSYARNEDLNFENVDPYRYSNNMGLSVEIIPSGNGKNSAKYNLFYKGINYYSAQYTLVGLALTNGPFYSMPLIKKFNLVDKNSKEYQMCYEIASKLPEMGDSIKEIRERDNLYFVIAHLGVARIDKDFTAVFFETYCKKSANFATKLLIGLHDLKEDERIFVTSLGMNNSVLSFADEEEAKKTNGTSNLFEQHMFTSARISKDKEISVENICSIISTDNTGFMLRTANSPAEGKVTIKVKDGACFAEIENRDGIFFNENNQFLFPRDVFGVPTPIQMH